MSNYIKVTALAESEHSEQLKEMGISTRNEYAFIDAVLDLNRIESFHVVGAFTMVVLYSGDIYTVRMCLGDFHKLVKRNRQSWFKRVINKLNNK